MIKPTHLLHSHTVCMRSSWVNGLTMRKYDRLFVVSSQASSYSTSHISPQLPRDLHSPPRTPNSCLSRKHSTSSPCSKRGKKPRHFTGFLYASSDFSNACRQQARCSPGPEIATPPVLNLAPISTVLLYPAVLAARGYECHATADRNARCLGPPCSKRLALHGKVTVHVLRSCYGDACGPNIS